MALMTCRAFLNDLRLRMEGTPSRDAEAHIRNCPSCRHITEDLNAIHSAARSWRAEEIEPPAHLWASLRLQLEREGLIRDDRGSQLELSNSGWFSRWFAGLPRPALAGGYLVLLIAVAFGFSRPANRQANEARWLEGTQVSTSPLSAQLTAEQVSFASFNDSNPAVTASLNKNLAIVDNYIALCEKSVQEEPQNEVARDYLYEAYQQKADLLAQMTERGENNR